MQLLREWGSSRLERMITALVALGLVLIGFELVGRVLSFLGRFRQEILLFILGALLAFVLAPLVSVIQRFVRKRWAAIAGAYLGVLLTMAVCGVILLNPFVHQVRGLIGNLSQPSARELVKVKAVRTDLVRLNRDMHSQLQTVGAVGIPSIERQRTLREIRAGAAMVASLAAGKGPAAEIRVPPSYLKPMAVDLTSLSQAYGALTGHARLSDLRKAVRWARLASSSSRRAYAKASSTPMLLLNLQVWLDHRGISVDLHDKFGNALQELSRQVSSILNSALGLVLEAGNLLLSTVLVLLISIYFLADGARFIAWLVSLTPTAQRPRAAYLVSRLDAILGSYLRTMLVIAVMSAILSAVGAVIFGVPYAVVIFFSSFFLALIPVIGPVILPLPPLVIAVIFTPLPTTIGFLVWLLAVEQLATNVIGPRLQGRNVGIHPLEAMAAALIGFPLAGVLGAFFAVPTAAFLHVVVREFLRSSGPTPTLPPGYEASALYSAMHEVTPPP